jgi:SAM-dependent methyltransferase
MPAGSPNLLARHGVQVVDRSTWDRQYHRGRWNYLRESGEKERYSAIADRIYSVGAYHVLDLGCGEGLLLRQLDLAGFAGRYVGVDWSYKALARHRPREGRFFVCADLTQLSFAENFDVVVLSEVLYYLPDPWSALQNSLQLVAPAGELLLTLYHPPADRLPAWHSYIGELEERLHQHESTESMHELSAAEGARIWALYVLSRQANPDRVAERETRCARPHDK